MPAATRIDDADVPHCTAMDRAQGSANVYVNGRKWSCEGDLNTVHLKLPNVPPCPPHTAAIVSGSSTVKVNGDGAGRIGDATCTSVAAGSSNVFAGP